MHRVTIADLFSGAGGAAKGLQQAGFHVVGFDIKPQPRYAGDEFHQVDALTVDLNKFDAVWASPPCQRYSNLNKGTVGNADSKPDLVGPTRTFLKRFDRPWIIENVIGAPLINPLVLCGSMFDPMLDIWRHRGFESSVKLIPPDWPCRHALYGPRYEVRHHKRKHMTRVTWVYGHAHSKGETDRRKVAMGIDWMTRAELTQAIPPTYAEYLGKQLMDCLKSEWKVNDGPINEG